jgi:hypothetical protein
MTVTSVADDSSVRTSVLKFSSGIAMIATTQQQAETAAFGYPRER